MACALAILACQSTPTAEHCLAPSPLAPQRSIEFEREALALLKTGGWLDWWEYPSALGPFRPSFSGHSLSLRGSKLNAYSLSVFLQDVTAQDLGRVGSYGPFHVVGTIDHSTCEAKITDGPASADWVHD